MIAGSALKRRDHRFDLGLGRRGRQVLAHREHAHLGAVLVLHRHVALARRVVADEHGAQPDGDALVRRSRATRSATSALHPGRHGFAVEQDRCHQSLQLSAGSAARR